MNEEKLNAFKIELLQALIDCNDVEKLNRIKAILNKKHFSVREETSQYSIKKNDNLVPQNFYDELEKDFELYQKGKLEAKSWDEVKQGLKERINILS
ncbi:hypothetical protein [Mesonia mobilis]|uniref:hypothetical protein n=1 Tax=Mesonia mobilis TaxID=369791 RepID=UPI0026ED7FB0|nr:hypothetical protein [Mesonia mobilis]